MSTKLPLTSSIRDKLKLAIKNREDISSLIDDYSIKDEYLANAVIKKLNRRNEDMRNINFANSIIGEEGIITNLCQNDMRGCNFSGVKFLGKIWFKHTDLRNSNFTNAYLVNVEYQFADLRNIVVCSMVFKYGADEGFGCKFSKKIFDDLGKYWEIE